MTTMTSLARPQRPVGELLREWRERRRLSQLDLSIQADISTRHLSFVETGRSRPTPAMIIRLTEQLDVPLRERNTLLLAAGYAPAYPQHGLDEPELSSVRAALRQLLAGHEPYPAVVINRWWEMLDGNAGVSLLVDGCAPWLLEPPVNVLRLSLHPDGMAPRILNLAQWRAHLLTQLQHRSQALGDERLMELHGELLGYPGGHSGLVSAHGAASPTGHRSPPGVVLPLRYRHGERELSFFSISASVGTATDVTVDELTIEAFYPADAATAAALRAAGYPDEEP
jgi:transcriptional regulator with XRE-family HTH domain